MIQNITKADIYMFVAIHDQRLQILLNGAEEIAFMGLAGFDPGFGSLLPSEFSYKLLEELKRGARYTTSITQEYANVRDLLNGLQDRFQYYNERCTGELLPEDERLIGIMKNIGLQLNGNTELLKIEERDVYSAIDEWKLKNPDIYQEEAMEISKV